MFELKTGDQIVKLKWGTYAMRLFTDMRGKEIDHFFEVLQEIYEKLATPQKMFLIIQDLLMAGYEYANDAKINEKQACEWIDECGGILRVNEGQLIDYINYVISKTFNNVSSLPNDQPALEKKNEEAVGMIS